MNYLDAERTRYQNQDRYATSPEASGQETRAFHSSRLLVLVSWFFAQPDYQDATPEAVPIPMAIGTIGTSGNYLD
ncbi:MAG TPA: hypothetical protein VGA80_08040 [Flavobacteriaceae bacterium]